MAITNEHAHYALVTGGTSGIGYELAKLCAKEGNNIILVARSEDRLKAVSSELKKEYGVDVITLAKDLFEPHAAHEVYNEVKAKRLTVNILINDAGQGELGSFTSVPLQRHLDLIQLNVVTLVTLTKLFLDDMVERDEGSNLQLASVVSKTPAPEFAVYAASKAFVLSFSEALARELEDTNVTITALLPGRTDTDFFYKAHMEDTKEYQEHKLADPADVAAYGFEAMMNGESRVIAGAENRMMVGMMNMKPDSANAAQMEKNAHPSDKSPDERKKHSEHRASQEERGNIGKPKGDRQDKTGR
jgi:short-subunit dehydrogenase